MGWRRETGKISLPLKDQVCSLGVPLFEPACPAPGDDCCLGQLLPVSTSMSQHPYLDQLDMAMIAHALVTSKLDYCQTL